MTRDIGNMDTPPYGTPIQEIEIRGRITPVELPATRPRQKTPASREDIVEDIYVLGRWFARPRVWPTRSSLYYFRLNTQNYVKVAGGIDLNKRFVEPLRELAYAGAHLHDFLAIVGRLGTSFHFSDTPCNFSKDYDAWHDLILKAFFIDILRTSYPVAGEVLAQFWTRDLDGFARTFSHLRRISTNSHCDNYSRAAALRVFGYAEPFFKRCSKTPRYDEYRQAALEHFDFFQTYRDPLIATAAAFSSRALLRIGR